jgi:hypothetical protein
VPGRLQQLGRPAGRQAVGGAATKTTLSKGPIDVDGADTCALNGRNDVNKIMLHGRLKLLEEARDDCVPQTHDWQAEKCADVGRCAEHLGLDLELLEDHE